MNRGARLMHGATGTHPTRTPRWSAVAAPATLLVLLAAFGVLQHGPASAQADPDITLEATATVTRQVQLDEMISSPTRSVNASEQGCQEIEVDGNVDGTGFRFSDVSSANQCGWMAYLFTPPEGVDRFILRFVADRSIEHPGDTSLPVVAFQEVQLARQDDVGTRIGQVAYFDSSSSTRPPTPFEIGFPTQGGGPLNLTWYFEDRGTETRGVQGLVTSGTEFQANVNLPNVTFENVHVASGQIIDQSVADTNTTRITTTNATIEIPRLLENAQDKATVSVRIGTTDRLVGVTSPQGVPLNLAVLDTVGAGALQRLVLDTQVLSDVGPGTYTFTFEREEPLPPAAAPAPPATIFPLVYLASVLPAPPAIYAYIQTLRARKQSEGLSTGRVGGIFLAALLLTLGYVALLLILYVADRLRPVATLPFHTESVLTLVGFVILAILFILLGLYVARVVLRALQEDLEERRRIQAELERSNQELEHFAYVASHDLQEPLRTISGFSQLLKRRYGEELDDRAVKYIDRTVQGTDRMGRLINDLLEYSRVDSRGRPIETTDLNKVAAEVMEDLEHLIADAGAKVDVRHLPTAPADKTQIGQVLSNLIRNAIKYRHPDRAPEVEVSSTQEGNDWVISVADNGVGIPEDQQERAFIIFQRLVARETDDTGTGLGLAISKKIIERHGGRIWVDSDGESGSVFHFTLPKKAPQSDGPKPAKRYRAKNAKKAKDTARADPQADGSAEPG